MPTTRSIGEYQFSGLQSNALRDTVLQAKATEAIVLLPVLVLWNPPPCVDSRRRSLRVPSAVLCRALRACWQTTNELHSALNMLHGRANPGLEGVATAPKQCSAPRFCKHGSTTTHQPLPASPQVLVFASRCAKCDVVLLACGGQVGVSKRDHLHSAGERALVPRWCRADQHLAR